MQIVTSVLDMAAPMADEVARVRDGIWVELERQAERFGHVDRDRSVIDMTAIELDMDQVAAAAINAINAAPAPRAGRRAIPLSVAADRTVDMARRIEAKISQAIAGVPNLLGTTQTRLGDTHPTTLVYTPEQVAARIAAVLPSLLQAAGCLLVELPEVGLDEYGSESVRVPLGGQPWADGAVRLDRTPRGNRLALSGIPTPLAADDAPTVAAALLAMHLAAEQPS
ncbi:hypothetical protein [Mycobacteroides salmoniphilum]|uniref:hypothetical protein n=1 Tax=Mycobacteroides salmoniphilum TaxID=404941 RepID=UPI0010E35D6B|nr:hypothetical protein [Mycobacteroides salmoniphilum]TDZ94802.1 hypothetical protein CCUG62472_01616 [Mycobacteroides salmoniphilum]